MRVKNDATSLTDKLRIANKVNNKYSESLMEKVKLLEDLQIEVGAENVDELLNNANNGILSSGEWREVDATFWLTELHLNFPFIAAVIVGSNLCNTISSS